MIGAAAGGGSGLAGVAGDGPPWRRLESEARRESGIEK